MEPHSAFVLIPETAIELGSLIPETAMVAVLIPETAIELGSD